MMTGFKSRTPPSDKVRDPLCQPSRNRYPLPSEPVFLIKIKPLTNYLEMLFYHHTIND